MIIRKPTVGPILGWTTKNSARLWARGEHNPEHRTFGAGRIRPSGARRFRPAKVFKMKPLFDFTGIADFKSLTTNSSYEYQIGYFFADGEPGEQKIVGTDDWSGAASGTFRTAAPDNTHETSFVFGSCRYLLRFFGGLLWDERGDTTFRSVKKQIDDGKRTDLLLMIGDQIYADDLGFLFPDDQVDEFFSRYRTVFGQPHIGELMGRVPTYMAMDDHEISNDWEQGRFKGEEDLYAAAIHAYECYQFVHGPGFRYSGNPRRSSTPHKLWYTFRHGKSAFFVTDTRTERYSSYSPPQLIGPGQMDALKQWLLAGGGITKFVVTSVPFFPDSRWGGEDQWSGFNEQRLEILDFICAEKVRKVVFLSGDVHCSMAGQLKCPSDPDFLVTSIISSSFFWPYPQGQEWNFNLEGTLCTGEGGNYELCGFEDVYAKDNFTRVTTSRDSLDIEFFERKGARLGSRSLSL